MRNELPQTHHTNHRSPVMKQDLFTKHWNIYRKIIARNYMQHREFGEEIRLVLDHFDPEQPLRVLDLGCGDAYQMAIQLKGRVVESYSGYDLAGPALALAEGNMKGLASEVRLEEGKMEELITREKGDFNIIYSSYAIHHLADEEKKVLVGEIRKRLAANGVFILIDTFRTGGESREEYLSRYLKHWLEQWVALTPEERGLVRDHIVTYDYPAFLEDMNQWAVEAGFEVEERPVYDRNHRMIVFK